MRKVDKVLELLAEARALCDELTIDGVKFGEDTDCDNAFYDVFEKLDTAQEAVGFYFDLE
jgi:hypothetical protein